MNEMCKVFLLSQDVLEMWFEKATGTDQHPWYESAATNFVAQNAVLICGSPVARVWVEMKLGSEEKGDETSPDVIIETKSKKLWIVEVKYTDDESVIEKAKTQVIEYRESVDALGWWPNHERNLAVVWAFYDVKPTDGTELTCN